MPPRSKWKKTSSRSDCRQELTDRGSALERVARCEESSGLGPGSRYPKLAPLASLKEYWVPRSEMPFAIEQNRVRKGKPKMRGLVEEIQGFAWACRNVEGSVV